MKRVVIGLVVLALAVTAFLVFRQRQDRQARAQRAEGRLLQFDERRVDAVDIVLRDSRWRFEQRGDGWIVVSPVRDLADPDGITRLMGLLRVSRVVRRIEEPESLEAYGLEPAAAEVRLGGIAQPAVRLGDTVPTQDGVFAAVDGREGILVISVVPDDLMLALEPARLRDASLPGLRASVVERIDLGKDGVWCTIVRENDGWWIEAPRRLPASDAAANRLLESLEKAEAVAFLDGVAADRAEAGLGESSPTVVLHSAGQERTIRLGALLEDGFLLAKREDRDPILVVPGELQERVSVRVEDYLARKLTKVNRYTVTQFSYSQGPATLVARRSGDAGWTTEDGSRISDETVYPLLVRLLEMPVTAWQEMPGGDAGAGGSILEFRTETGSTGRIVYRRDGTAVMDSLPGVGFTVRTPPPPVPAIP